MEQQKQPLDLQVHVASFLDVHALGYLCCSCHHFHHLSESHDAVIWRAHVESQRLFAPMQLESIVMDIHDGSEGGGEGPAAVTLPDAVESFSDLKAMLRFQSWQELLHAQFLLGGACIGLWRRTSSNFNHDYRGQLVCLRPVSSMGGLLLEAIKPDGTMTATHCIRFSRRRAAGGRGPGLSLEVHGLGVEERGLVRGGSSADRWEWVKKDGPVAVSPTIYLATSANTQMHGFILQRRSETRTYYPLSASPPVWGALERHLEEAQHKQLLSQLCGLWKGNYGPHGEEILSVEIACHGMNGDDQPTQILAPHLIGVKVTGDANVPAGEWSFICDLGESQNIDERLDADTRPVYSLSVHGHEERDLRLERQDIKLWIRAMGQINALPGLWRPRQVGCDLLVYQRASSSRPTLSVLWDDLGFQIRHVIDFQPLTVSKAAVSQRGGALCPL